MHWNLRIGCRKTTPNFCTAMQTLAIVVHRLSLVEYTRLGTHLPVGTKGLNHKKIETDAGGHRHIVGPKRKSEAVNNQEGLHNETHHRGANKSILKNRINLTSTLGCSQAPLCKLDEYTAWKNLLPPPKSDASNAEPICTSAAKVFLVLQLYWNACC